MIGFGASPYSVSDGHLVRRVQLDEVCPDKPLFLVKYDGHACVVNTVLFKRSARARCSICAVFMRIPGR